MVFQSLINSGNFTTLVFLLIGAILTLMYCSKAWLEIFFGEPVDFDRSRTSKKEVLSVIILAVLILFLGINFEAVYQVIEKAAQASLDTQAYTETVLGETK